MRLSVILSTLILVVSSQSLANENNLTSNTVLMTIGIFNLEYSRKISEHWTVGLTGARGTSHLGDFEVSGSSYGFIARRYFDKALDKDSWYLALAGDQPDYRITLISENTSYYADSKDFVISGGGGYQWFWKSFNIGIGLLLTNKTPLELKSEAGLSYKDKLSSPIGIDFTMGGSF